MAESIICLTEVSLLWYSTSFPLLCFRRVAFRRVFRPLISASCFRRVVFGELFSTSFPRFISYNESTSLCVNTIYCYYEYVSLLILAQSHSPHYLHSLRAGATQCPYLYLVDAVKSSQNFTNNHNI